jgi:hypothetical protein
VECHGGGTQAEVGRSQELIAKANWQGGGRLKRQATKPGKSSLALQRTDMPVPTRAIHKEHGGLRLLELGTQEDSSVSKRNSKNDNLTPGKSGNIKAKPGITGLSSGPFLSRLSACSALYGDFLSLLASGNLARSPVEFRALIVEENCLARRTSSSRIKAWKELKARYILDTSNELFGDFLIEWRRCLGDQERALTAYCLLALNDRLVANLGLDYLFPRLLNAPAEIRQDDILAYLQAVEPIHPELKKWSRNTTIAVSQKYAASIRDFGLASGIYKKQTVRPALYASPMRFLIRALKSVGESDLEIVRSPWFKLIGLDSHEVIDALSELSRQGKLWFRMQADVVELDLERNQP